MRFQGEETFRQPREKVWAVLRDPNRFQDAFGDLKELQVISPNEFTAVIRAGVSVIRGDFRFRFRVAEEAPPSRLVIVAQGKGLGSAIDLRIEGNLAEDPGPTTRLSWVSEAQVSGTLAGIAQRLLDQAAGKTIREVFTNLHGVVERTG